MLIYSQLKLVQSWRNNMKILVLTGSPHKKGTSSMMADYFIEGAKSVGNEVVRIDTAFMNINSCRGCGYCRKNNDKCIQDDDMKYVVKDLLDADMVVFATADELLQDVPHQEFLAIVKESIIHCCLYLRYQMSAKARVGGIGTLTLPCKPTYLSP